jgi:hypothetical protein
VRLCANFAKFFEGIIVLAIRETRFCLLVQVPTQQPTALSFKLELPCSCSFVASMLGIYLFRSSVIPYSALFVWKTMSGSGIE